MYQSFLYALTRADLLFFDIVKQNLSPGITDRILEIGCSMGRLAKKVQDLAPHTCGIDVNQKAIEAGVTQNLQVMDATQLAFPDASFDKIYSANTIEHIPDLKRALREMARVVKKGGRILLIYPAEPIRGLFCLLSALLLWQNPLRIHIHRLFPRRLIQEFLGGTGLVHTKSRFSFLPGLHYITILEKS